MKFKMCVRTDSFSVIIPKLFENVGMYRFRQEDLKSENHFQVIAWSHLNPSMRVQMLTLKHYVLRLLLDN